MPSALWLNGDYTHTDGYDWCCPCLTKLLGSKSLQVLSTRDPRQYLLLKVLKARGLGSELRVARCGVQPLHTTDIGLAAGEEFLSNNRIVVAATTACTSRRSNTWHFLFLNSVLVTGSGKSNADVWETRFNVERGISVWMKLKQAIMYLNAHNNQILTFYDNSKFTVDGKQKLHNVVQPWKILHKQSVGIDASESLLHKQSISECKR